MPSGTLAHARRSATWTAWLRVIVAALVALHVVLVADELAAQGLLTTAVLACALLGASVLVGLATMRFEPLGRRAGTLALARANQVNSSVGSPLRASSSSRFAAALSP